MAASFLLIEMAFTKSHTKIKRPFLLKRAFPVSFPPEF